LANGIKTLGFKKVWRKNEELKFIIHGWSGVGHEGPKKLLDIKNGLEKIFKLSIITEYNLSIISFEKIFLLIIFTAYLINKHRKGNFIFVDWSDYSQNLIYAYVNCKQMRLVLSETRFY